MGRCDASLPDQFLQGTNPTEGWRPAMKPHSGKGKREDRFVVLETCDDDFISSGERLMSKEEATNFIERRIFPSQFTIYELVPIPTTKRGRKK